MITTRDIQQQNQAKLDAKRDNSQVTRAVILEINGSVWANESERRVWYLPNGATQPGQVLCIRGGVRPQDNLPVLVGKADGSDVLEVLSVDPLVMVNQAALPPQVADHAREHEPGGRDVLNLYSRQLVPLQVYYAGSGLLISVVSGWYDYRGTLTRFKGRQNFDLASNQPTSGNVRKVGIYIDGANTLQAVDGSTVADTVTNIPEPVWPANSFPLCIVTLNGTQTTIAYLDIQDRRGLFGLSDINLFPPESKVIIDTTTYDTLTAANTAAGAGDFVHIGPGSLSFDNLTLKAATYKGQGKDITILASTYASGTVLTIPDDCIIENLTIDHSFTSGSSRTTLGYAGTGEATIRNCRIIVANASSGGGIGIANSGGGTLHLENVEVVEDGGSGITYPLYVFNSSTVNAYSCIFTAITTGGYVTGGLPYHRTVGVLDSTSVVNLYDCKLTPERIWRNGDFSPANITWGWAASPPAQFNPIVNGGLEIWQRGTSFPAAASGTFSADRFQYLESGAMVHTVAQSTDVPTVAQAGQLFPYSYLADCTTAQATIVSSQSASISHQIEGFNWLKFAQDAFWLGFWVKATKTGTYCVSFKNSGNDRSFIAEYTVNTTATWEYKEILVTASPSAGTWDYGNGRGLQIRWCLAAGPDVQTTPWAWQTGSYIASANQVNACDSIANDWRITGIMMSKTRSPFWQPDYEVELGRAQRYYWQVGESDIAYGHAYSTTGLRMFIPTPVQMRAIPTIGTSGTYRVQGFGGAINITGTTVLAAYPQGLSMNITVASGLTTNQVYTILASAMTASAEL